LALYYSFDLKDLHVESSINPGSLKTVSAGKYQYSISAADLKLEQQAFEPGEGVSKV